MQIVWSFSIANRLENYGGSAMQINHFDHTVRVRCELGFPDKDGKVESVSHEDVRRELQSISDRYGSNNVMIEFSAEAGMGIMCRK